MVSDVEASHERLGFGLDVPLHSDNPRTSGSRRFGVRGLQETWARFIMSRDCLLDWEGVDIEIEDFVAPGNPGGEVERLTGMFHPASSTLTIAKTARSRVNAFGLSFSHQGKNGHSAPFSWAA